MPLNAIQVLEYTAAIDTCAFFDLSDHGKIELKGPDARLFMHNLCTQDVQNLAPGSCREAFLTTAKARIIAHLWVGHYETEDGAVLWLDMDSGQAERVLQHLNHYLISERVELADRTSGLGFLRLVGPQSAALLTQLVGSQPSTLMPMHHMFVPGFAFIRRQNLLAQDGFDLFCPMAELPGLRQRLIEAGASAASISTYDLLRIEAGLPAHGCEIDETRLAMESGRAVQAICYTKGCYLGQETIVMARDRGQVNRLLMGIQVSGEGALAPGSKLLNAQEEVGKITSAQYSPRLGQWVALAYVRRGHWEPGSKWVVEPEVDGREATVCSLPFIAVSPPDYKAQSRSPD